MRTQACFALVAATACALLSPSPSQAADVGVAGQRFVATRSAASGKESLRSTQKDTKVTAGNGSAASEVNGTFEAYYVDAPANRSTLGMPSPWLLNTGVLASFRNRLAPGGPTGVSTAKVVRTKTAQVVAKSLGGLDLTNAPGPGGVLTVFTVHNGGDATTHRMCTLYRTASGSKIAHKRTATSAKLTLTKGVPAPCPTCNDGSKNDRETDVDCGGPSCQVCGVGQSCGTGSDCDTGLCTGGVCAATCDDGQRNGLETDVDCGGGQCPDCGTGGACNSGNDCLSGVCTALLCQAPTCGDGVRNQGESDVDCGGPCSACVPFTVTIDSPAHGTFSPAGTATITGHTTGVGPAGADLTINGNPVALAPGGTFSTVIPLVPSAAFNPAYARLVRRFDGLTAYDRIVVIAGQSIADGSASPNGVAMRVNDRGLDAVEPIATTLVEIDPATLVTPGTPVIEDFCYAELGSLCLGSVDATISNTPPPSVGPLGIAIDSHVGFVAGDISIQDLRVTVNIDNASGLPIHCELQLTVPLTEIAGDYGFSPLAAQPTKVDVTQVGGVAVSAHGTTFQTDCDGILGPIAEALIPQAVGDVGALFADGMQDFLNQVDGNGNTAIAGALETALGGIDIAGPVGSGLGVDLYTPFTSIVEDTVGITFATDIRATTLVPDPLAPNLAASLHIPESFPSFGATTPVQNAPYGIGLGISTSGFNQLLKSQTESGLMRSAITEIDLFGGAPVAITAGLLAAGFPPFGALPANTPIAIRIAPTLAPVITGQSGPNGELGEIRIGQILVEFVENMGQAGEATHVALAVDVRLGLELAFQPDGIGFVLAEPAASDLTVALLDNPLGVSEASLQGFLPQMLSSSLPVLASALQSFPLPEFIGLGLSGVEISRNGQYYSIFADLTPDCTDGSQCPSGVCLAPNCQAPTCTDGIENGGETDLDCGGGACPGCDTGESCFLSTDCASGGCSGGVCQPGCTTGAECASGVCTGGFCRVANCADGAQNGQETDVDCGGPAPNCVRCLDGDTCGSGSDCTSLVCTGGVCQPPTCTDGVKNGSEIGVDCGGGSCPGCPLGSTCATGSDCQSGTCGLNARCTCGNRLFTFTVNSNSGGLVDSAEWPGGTASQTGPVGCSVTINRPNNNIDLVCTLAAPFSVQSFAGYSNCFGSGGEDNDGCQPVSCPPLGIGSCCSGRPSCSAALNGSGSARYHVQCLE